MDNSLTWKCWNCGMFGHTKDRCPVVMPNPPAARPPAAADDRVKPQVCLRCGLPHEGTCNHKPADYETAGESARQLLGYSSDPFVRSEFRRQMQLPLRTEAQLRSMALQQVEEHREFLNRAEISASSGRTLAATHPAQTPATTPPPTAP